MATIGVIGRKGGTGKTTVAVNLAAVLAERGRVVRLVDGDPQASTSAWAADFSGVHVIHAPTATELRRALAAPGADICIADGPPYDAELAGIIFSAADVVVVPVTPSLLDIQAARPLLEAIAAGHRCGLVVLTLCTVGTTAPLRARAALASFGVPIAKTELCRRIAHVESVALRMPVTVYESKGQAAGEVRALAAEVWRLMKET